jgi:transcriptional regulator with XRE-family HTH domain
MPHPVDIHVGKVIRQIRRESGLTQQHLAERVGIKFQQIQKYETGANRVSASRLWEISRVLNVPVSRFFANYQPQSDSVEAESLSNN